MWQNFPRHASNIRTGCWAKVLDDNNQHYFGRTKIKKVQPDDMPTLSCGIIHCSAKDMNELHRKLVIAIGAVVSFLLVACNSVGPYGASVYKLDDSTYRVNLRTWIGGPTWPKGSEELKRKSEVEASAALHRLGLEFESCVFQAFVPYEGGHMTICLLAGKKESVNRWIAMPDKAFDQWLREHPGENEIGRIDGRLP